MGKAVGLDLETVWNHGRILHADSRELLQHIRKQPENGLKRKIIAQTSEITRKQFKSSKNVEDKLK